MKYSAVAVVYVVIEYVMAYLTVPTERTNATAVCTSSFSGNTTYRYVAYP